MSNAAMTLEAPRTLPTGAPYRYYALTVLALVAAFNAADRKILSILAEAIKADLQISDGTLAFLYGTAFAMLYTLLGLPAARLADRLHRPRFLAAGVAMWTSCTALGGLTSSFGGLASARIGVGVGEATANPTSHSLICDLFPREQRSRALAVNLAGLFIGGGLTATAGGYILDIWPQRCDAMGLCSIRPWQAAFLIIGLVGLPLAALVYTLREVPRGGSEGKPVEMAPGNPWVLAWQDLLSVLPVIGTLTMWRHCGPRAATRHAVIALGVLSAALALGWLTGDYFQWVALFIGVNAITSWAELTRANDPTVIRLTFGTPAFVLAVGGYAFTGALMGAAAFWMVPYAMRMLAISATEAGLVLGPVIAAGSLVGTLLGGYGSDKWRTRDARGYLFWSLVVLVALAASFALMLQMTTLASYAAAAFLCSVTAVGWSSSAGAQAQDLVLPRMRSVTSAINALSITLVSMAVGPYLAGRIGEATGSLHTGLMWMLAVVPFAAALLLLASRLVEKAEATKEDRAALA